MRPSDTTAEARAAQLQVYRAMSPVERLETALTMSDQVMAIAAAGVRHRHPDLSAATGST